MAADDPLEAVSGTNGVTGAADAVLVLNRDAKGTTLYGRGRDIEDRAIDIEQDGAFPQIGNERDLRKLHVEARNVGCNIHF